MEIVDKDENPYVAVVARKYRNLKKKLDKILKAEDAHKTSGKALNQDQLELIASKPSIEKALADVDSIKVQLEEVAKEESLKNITTQPVTSNSTSQTKTPDLLEVSTETIQIETQTIQTQSETHHSVDVATGSETTTPTTTSNQDIKSDFYVKHLQNQIFKLLQVLHVCARYTSTTGQPLPPDVEFFGMSLLGKTSISGFQDTLLQSTRSALLYLDSEEAPRNEVSRGISFSQIAAFVDQLTLDMGPTPASGPTLNFFADSEPAPAAATVTTTATTMKASDTVVEKEEEDGVEEDDDGEDEAEEEEVVGEGVPPTGAGPEVDASGALVSSTSTAQPKEGESMRRGRPPPRGPRGSGPVPSRGEGGRGVGRGRREGGRSEGGRVEGREGRGRSGRGGGVPRGPPQTREAVSGDAIGATASAPVSAPVSSTIGATDGQVPIAPSGPANDGAEGRGRGRGGGRGWGVVDGGRGGGDSSGGRGPGLGARGSGRGPPSRGGREDGRGRGRGDGRGDFRGGGGRGDGRGRGEGRGGEGRGEGRGGRTSGRGPPKPSPTAPPTAPPTAGA